MKPRIIKANKNCYLTQNKDVDILDRTFSKFIILSLDMRESDFKSISCEEATKIMDEQNKILLEKQFQNLNNL